MNLLIVNQFKSSKMNNSKMWNSKMWNLLHKSHYWKFIFENLIEMSFIFEFFSFEMVSIFYFWVLNIFSFLNYWLLKFEMVFNFEFFWNGFHFWIFDYWKYFSISTYWFLHRGNLESKFWPGGPEFWFKISGATYLGFIQVSCASSVGA